MSKKKKIRSVKSSQPQSRSETKPKKAKEKKTSLLPWILPVLLVTAICLSPMLRNSFTNWDDEYYVVQNAIVAWAGLGRNF